MTWAQKGWPSSTQSANSLICIMVMGKMTSLSQFALDFPGIGTESPTSEKSLYLGIVVHFSHGRDQRRHSRFTNEMTPRNLMDVIKDSKHFSSIPEMIGIFQLPSHMHGAPACPWPPRFWNRMLLMHWLCHFLFTTKSKGNIKRIGTDAASQPAGSHPYLWVA